MAKTENKKKKTFTHNNAIHMYTDGSFRPGGNAACAYVIFSERTKHILKMSCSAHRGSTINQMELMAINKALDFPNSDYAVIYTDSAYCIGCLTQWWRAWITRDWKSPQGDPIKNKELIQEILEKIKRKKHVKFMKVSAHTGDPFNSLADYLATKLTAKMVEDPSIIDQEYTQ